MRTPVILGLVVSCALLASTAGANGRFPRAQRLLEQNGDPNRLILSATYGLLITNDRGADWRHICELGFAFTIDEIDPLFELPPDGSMLVQAPRSLNRSPSPFCSFEPVLGGTSAETVVDFSLDASDRERVLALLIGRGATGGPLNRLEESRDQGRSFEPLGSPLPEDEVMLGVTIDAAPSDPMRVYVTATGVTNPGVFARSDDRGTRWTTTTLSIALGETAYLAGVHPTNRDVVYVRTDGWVSQDGTTLANDALFVSDDGGETFVEVDRRAGKLFGFALSPDGSEVVIGYGDPVDPSRAVDSEVLGLYRASAEDHAFSRIFSGPISCLTWSPAGLYACTSQTEHGYALGFTSDLDFDSSDPDPFEPLLDLARVRPLECPACSAGAVCQAAWSDNCAVLGACDGGVAGNANGGTGGMACTQGDAGDAGEGPSATGGRPANPPAPTSSCGCRVTGAPSPRAPLAVLLLLALVRRVRKSSPHPCGFESRTRRLAGPKL